MNLTDITKIRLLSQQIAQTKFQTPKGIVSWMGAMQAQDYAMAKWGVGVRLPNSTDQAVGTALNNGEIIRTHLLRPTWHFVSADDIYWMLDLTSPKIRSSLKSRWKELELNETVFRKCNTLIEKTLGEEKHLNRNELVSEFKKNKIEIKDNRASHLLLRAELDGLICSGTTKDGKQTYALLEERVLKTKSLTKEEALTKLAMKYFSSHCPATLQDFVWWSGLSASDAKSALEMVKSDFIAETIATQTYWFTNSFSFMKNNTESFYVLPAFDEYIISYKNRSAAFPGGINNKAVSNNGVFRPIFVVNGQVTGIWKRTLKKEKVLVETEFFKRPDKNVRNSIEKAFEKFGKFLEKKIEFK